jgi:hypothetical protein
MYHGLFACIMYASNCLELCTMYDSHGVYLRVLWTICMYKFSTTHVVIFHGFFVPFTEFRQKSAGFWQKPSGTRRIGLSVKPADLSPKPAAFRCSRFLLFLHRLRCVSAKFFRFSPIFADFFKNRRDPCRRFFPFVAITLLQVGATIASTMLSTLPCPLSL